jgi:hypothetical protein
VPRDGHQTEPAQWKSLEVIADVVPPQPHELGQT